MTPWWLLTLGGLLGSAHCVGMCGGIAALVGLNTKSFASNLRSQMVFSCGRLMSYAFLGGVAAFAGRRLVEAVPQVAQVPAMLCIIAGLVLIREGILATGIFKQAVSGTSVSGCLLRPMFQAILGLPNQLRSLVTGIATGLFPCGLVYAFVALAASTHDFLSGVLTMLVFGLGTIPMMVMTGCGVSMLNWETRARFWKVAAWSVVITGMLTVGRGVAFMSFTTEQRETPCPFCSIKSPAVIPNGPTYEPAKTTQIPVQ